jgi:hypothetical protein
VYPERQKNANPLFAWQHSRNNTRKKKVKAMPPLSLFPSIAVLVVVVFSIAV